MRPKTTQLARRARKLKAEGHTFAEIGRRLGMSRQRASALVGGAERER